MNPEPYESETLNHYFLYNIHARARLLELGGAWCQLQNLNQPEANWGLVEQKGICYIESEMIQGFYRDHNGIV